MKIVTTKFLLAFLCFIVVFTLWNCKDKEDIPQIREPLPITTYVKDTTDISASLISSLLDSMPADILQLGHVWSDQNSVPTIADEKTELLRQAARVDESKLYSAPYISEIVGLKRNTTYYTRFYVKTNKETLYGPVISFTTKSDYLQRMLRILNDSLHRIKDGGYSYAIMRRGELVASDAQGWQRRISEYGPQIPMQTLSRFHIASMTKSVVAAAFVKIATEKGISLDTPFHSYLPSHWKKGAGLEKVTFRHLLRHESGFRGESGVDNGYIGLQMAIEDGVEIDRIGTFKYQNVNFALFRILIPSILGLQFNPENDTSNQYAAATMFQDYLAEHFYSPLGIDSQYMFTNHPQTPTIGYDYPYTPESIGFDPGNFFLTAGGYGLYLNSIESGKLFSALFDDNNELLLTKSQKKLLFDNQLGHFQVTTHYGNYFYHDGWSSMRSIQRTYIGFRTIWMKGPDDLLIVLLTNHIDRNDGLFPLRSFQYQDIVSYMLWVFSEVFPQTGNARTNQPTNFTQYLIHPEPY